VAILNSNPTVDQKNENNDTMQTVFIHHLNVFLAVRYYPLSLELFNILRCWRNHV